MTASQRAYGGRRTAQGGEVDASTAEKANRAFVRAVGRTRKAPLTEDAQAVIARSISEKALSDHVVSLARMLGFLVHRDPTWRATGTDPGYPDLTLLSPDGFIIFAELKAQDGRMSPAQEAWGLLLYNLMCATGNIADYYVWRPSDWLDGTIERVLRREG